MTRSEHPAARLTDPHESHEAAASVRRGTVTASHTFVLDFLAHHSPATQRDAVEYATHPVPVVEGAHVRVFSDSRIRTAFKELETAGRIIKCGSRPGRYGRSEATYMLAGDDK
ncbi:MAG: hypothetical protein SPI12_01710 [Actinomycetaceae bacterium]|nr:hypothetical protein [Actinomycetaceae bacterium]MDY6082564.1 hypothetical protein [Actinomycetaceae bacterium]